MANKHLTLLIEADLTQKTHEQRIIISRILDNELQEYLQFIDGKQYLEKRERRGGDFLCQFTGKK